MLISIAQLLFCTFEHHGLVDRVAFSLLLIFAKFLENVLSSSVINYLVCNHFRVLIFEGHF